MVTYRDRFNPEWVEFYEDFQPKTLQEHWQKWYEYDSTRLGYFVATAVMGFAWTSILWLLLVTFILVGG